MTKLPDCSLPQCHQSWACISNAFCFFFNDTATTEIYTLSLHDALPIFRRRCAGAARPFDPARPLARTSSDREQRSEEHTSELQSRLHLVCRLLLEKKKRYTPTVSFVCVNMRSSHPSSC